MEIYDIVRLFESSEIMFYLMIGGLFNITITLLDIGYDYFVGKERDWSDTGANIIITIMSELIGRTFFGVVGLVGLYLVSQIQVWQIPMNVWSWALGILAADLTYYWMHRFEHERRILWAYHSVHHSSSSYNLSVAGRLSVVEELMEWVFFIPMILIGFNVFQALASVLVVVVYQHWIHTEKIDRLGWLDELFNTPSVHRVHHGSNTQYWDKNYGGLLIIWDRLFGTYERECEPVIYGLEHSVDTYNPITINFIEYKRMWRDVKKCRAFSDKLKIVFGATGWRPDYFE